MKLFTSAINKQLFAQYHKGNDLKNQKVVAKIFNPYGSGFWYIINSDPNDPDYLWAIVKIFDIEVGSVSRKELESIRVAPYRLPLERDTSFEPVNAQELLDGLKDGKYYKDGGKTDYNSDLKLLEGKDEKYFVFPNSDKPESIGVQLAMGGNLSANGQQSLDFEGGGRDMASHGRLLSATNRDRAYESHEDYELRYSRKTKPKHPKYTYKTGGMMADGGEIMNHKFDKTISIQLIEPTSKGWKVKQYNSHSPSGKKLSKPKETTQYFSKDEIKQLFNKADNEGGMMEKGGEGSNLWVIFTKEWRKKPQIIEEFTSTHKTAKNKLTKLQRSKPNTDIQYLLTDKSNFQEKYGDMMAMGGETFEGKVKSIKSSLLSRKKVSPSVQKDYGKTYSPKEAEESAKRIVGAMTAKERMKKKIGSKKQK